VLAGTNATCRCHFVRIDPQGNPRVSALINMLVDQVVDYCIPRTRIEEAREHLLRTARPRRSPGDGAHARPPGDARGGNRDPTDFVAGLVTPVVLDEVQRVRDLLLAIKARVDRDPAPGSSC